MDVLLFNWWALALRGVVAILFGVLALVFPGITLASLVVLFGLYALIDGVIAVIGGIRAARMHERSTPFFLEGLVNILFAAVLVLWPQIGLLALIYMIAFWALVTGALLLGAAFRLQRMHGEWLLVANGVVSLVLGVALLAWPIAGIVVLAWWIGAYALVFGVLLLALAMRLRRHPDRL